MKLDRKSLEEAIAAGILPAEQAEALWRYLDQRHEDTPSFKPAHILYYLGGLIAVGALTLFMTLGWERFGGQGLLLISLAYGIGAIALTESLLSRGLNLPAGLTAPRSGSPSSAAVCSGSGTSRSSGIGCVTGSLKASRSSSSGEPEPMWVRALCCRPASGITDQ
ncbi:MAG TPA: hypothetical protein VFP36_02210 [Usitatibacter sp.]|nr:hypothetical protein [Usitatibacter sp.]